MEFVRCSSEIFEELSLEECRELTEIAELREILVSLGVYDYEFYYV